MGLAGEHLAHEPVWVKSGYTRLYLRYPVKLLSLQKYIECMDEVHEVKFEEKGSNPGEAHYAPGWIRLQHMCSDNKKRAFTVGITDLQTRVRGAKKGKRKEGVRHLYVQFDGSPKGVKEE